MRKLSFLVAAALALGACREASGPGPSSSGPAFRANPPPALGPVLVDGVPHVEQAPDFCGEAAAASYLQKLGKPYAQEDVFDISGMDPARGMGVTTRELKAALENIGFVVGPVWYTARADAAAADLDARFAELYADLAAGIPSIVCTHFDERPDTTEHFRLVLGYDPERDEVVYHDPALAAGAYLRMPRARLLELWPLKYRDDEWTVIRLRLQPGALRDPPAHGALRPAAFAQHVRQLHERAPSGFTIVVEPPFVVVGDGGVEAVRQSSTGTVRWAVDKLKQDFFDRDPEKLIDVWLFRDAESYEKNARAIFHEEPSTPYGYYSSDNKAMLMNIATGGGTLVHEIVHPFVEASFPDCPAWINEGLGSLFEQSAERDGHIVGLTNWRLEGLQRAIRGRGLPSFAALTATNDHAFYDDPNGTNYAQSRYLMYWLQEQGLLVRFWRKALAGRSADPSGWRALVDVLGESDMQAFQQRWQTWVLSLRFR
jgi:peptidase C39-like protein/uncharacterized protein DUF1570